MQSQQYPLREQPGYVQPQRSLLLSTLQTRPVIVRSDSATTTSY